MKKYSSRKCHKGRIAYRTPSRFFYYQHQKIAKRRVQNSKLK